MLDLLSNISTQWRQEEFLKICSEEKLAENLKAPQIEVTIPIKTIHHDHVTQVCEAHNQVIVSFLRQLQGGTRPTTEGSRENIGR